MTNKEAKYWLDRYNKEEDLYNTDLEVELRRKFQESRVMTKAELFNIVEWKFSANRHRKIRTKNLLKNINEKDVELISVAVFNMRDDQLRYRLLTAITGIGPAMASTILTFYDPDLYGIYDIHSWRGLMRSKEPKISSFKDVKLFWDYLRKEAREVRMSCRDLEKAYFKKDKENSRNRKNIKIL